MKVPRVTAIRDSPVRTTQGGALPPYGPIAGKSPLIQRQSRGRCI
jgi:hypothetical protein